MPTPVVLWPILVLVLVATATDLRSRRIPNWLVLPFLLAGISIFRHWSWWIGFSLIWLAHIGFDRTLGYGLKCPTAFKDTHLQRVD